MTTSTVLVVDDDFDIRESLVDFLLDGGFEAVSAKDGRDGMLELRTSPGVRVILLDLNMPMMGGAAFRAEQLKDPDLSSIPVIVLSANDDYAETAASIGASAALRKPFSPDALLGALEAYR
jgi:CheY-like chemotaxis protein